ncbi:MAG: hypothetical protein AAF569_04575 [Pseudomonadota bacterium]
MKRAEVARRLWNDYLKVEYYDLSELAREEWDPAKASHSVPHYTRDGDRVVGDAQEGEYIDSVYLQNGARDDHYAVRTYIMDTPTMGAQLNDGTFPDQDVWGEIQSNGSLPQGIPLVGRIMGVLGYRRGENNLGETYFSLNSPTGERTKNMFADAVHLDPPEDAPELPKQFVSQIHIADLKTTHPKLAAYITDMMLAAPDPLEGLEPIMEKLAHDDEVSEDEAHKFLESAAKSIKERPWKIPLENALSENWDIAKWEEECDRLNDVLAEHDGDPTEASQYAVWTIFNGLRVNHEAFLTGNIWDTMLCHIIDGRKVIDPAGTEKTLLDPDTGMELGGLLQAAVAAIPRTFSFDGPEGRRYDFNGEGPFVEYIERTMIKPNGHWERLNDAFLPGNAKQVFQSTMPKTRGAQSWAEEMKQEFESDPSALLQKCKERGWMKAAERLEKLV